MTKQKQGRPLLKDENKRCIVRSYTVRKDLFARFKEQIQNDPYRNISSVITDAFEEYLSDEYADE